MYNGSTAHVTRFNVNVERGLQCQTIQAKKGPQDRSKINLHEDYEVRYWSERFGVTQEKLGEVVKKAGNSIEAVERELKRVA